MKNTVILLTLIFVITSCENSILEGDTSEKIENNPPLPNPNYEYFAKTYEIYRSNFARSVVELTDGSYVILGFEDTYNDNYPTLTRVNADGYTIWKVKILAKGLGHPYQWVFLNALRKSSDGNLVIVGSYQNYDGRAEEMLIAKLNLNGSIIWDSVYGISKEENSNQYEIATNVIETIDGGFLLIGYEIPDDSTNMKYSIILKLSSTGEIMWSKKNNEYWLLI